MSADMKDAARIIAGVQKEFLDNLARLVRMGVVDPECPGCADTIAGVREGRWRPVGPGHKPSPACESGKHPHCSCDRCF